MADASRSSQKVVRGRVSWLFLMALVAIDGGTTPVVVYGDWLLSTRWGWEPGPLAVMDGAFYAFGALLAWLTLLGMSYSVRIADEGITVESRRPLGRGPLPGKTRLARWNEILGATSTPGKVDLDTKNPWLMISLDYNQARAILTDPRCPLAGRLPPKVARRLGLTGPTSGEHALA